MKKKQLIWKNIFLADQSELLLKCLLIGNTQVGKSCLLRRFCDRTFSFDVISTVGVDFSNLQREIEGQKLKVQIWDTAGQEKFRTITSNYYRNAHGVAVVYDITNRSSFEQISVWFEEIQKNAPEAVVSILIANKIDLEEERIVSREEGEKLARERNCPFFEVSAKSGDFVDEAFENLISKSYTKMKLSDTRPKSTINFSGKQRNKRAGCC